MNKMLRRVHFLKLLCTTSWSKHCGKAVFSTAVSECYSPTIDPNGELITSLQKLCKSGCLQEAVKLIDMQAVLVSPDAYRCVLQSCIIRKDLATGRKVHSLIQKGGLKSNSFLGSHLIRFFDLCGSLAEANEAFSDLPNPNVFAWSAIISACTKHGQGEQAIYLYQKMQASNVHPDTHTFVAGLKACAMEVALIQGMVLHGQIIEKGVDSMLYVNNVLIDMYGKCGNLQEARRVFDNHLERDIVTWNTMLAGYALSMQTDEVFKLFMCMLVEDKFDVITCVSVLNACTSGVALREGKLTFLLVVEKGFEQEEFVGSTVIDMYMKCGCLEDAYCVFDKLLKPDLVTWNVLIAGIIQYDELEHGYKTLEVFQKMTYQHCVMPDNITYASALKGCRCVRSLAQAKFIYSCIIERGMAMDVLLLNSLISTYADCGVLRDACRIFNTMQKRDAITWNAMIAGYSQHGLLQEACQLLQDLQQEGGTPDTAAWNSLIAGYWQQGYGWEALVLFKQMLQEGFLPDKLTFISVLNACASVEASELCRHIHLHILECNLLSDVFVSNSVIDMYAKSGSLVMARNVFDISSKQHVVTWNAMIAGYAQHGHHEEAHQLLQHMKKQRCNPDIITWNTMFAGLVQNDKVLEAFQLFGEMHVEGMQPDNTTFASMAKGCSLTGALNMGKLMYAYATASSYDSNTALCNSCIDMYSKCGSLREAVVLFKSLRIRDRVTWNTIIAAYALHNELRLSLTCFERMQREGFKPDIATYTSLLSACSHIGLLNEAYLSLRTMIEIPPTLQHFNCLMDLYGRAGHLSEAEGMLKMLRLHTDAISWITLLNNCRTYGNMELGRHCFAHLFGMDDSLGSVSVLM